MKKQGNSGYDRSHYSWMGLKENPNTESAVGTVLVLEFTAFPSLPS
jgi:hypothetical protein